VLDDSKPEFQKFKRENVTRWGNISQLLSILEKWIGKYNVTFTYISASKLLYYADMEMEKYTEDELIDCVYNKQHI